MSHLCYTSLHPDHHPCVCFARPTSSLAAWRGVTRCERDRGCQNKRSTVRPRLSFPQDLAENKPSTTRNMVHKIHGISQQVRDEGALPRIDGIRLVF